MKVQWFTPPSHFQIFHSQSSHTRFIPIYALLLGFVTLFATPSIAQADASSVLGEEFYREIGVRCVDGEIRCSGNGITASNVQSYTGEIDGANYLIRVPDDWSNGTLLVYAHGYRDKADQTGQTDNTDANAAPGGTVMEDLLLSQGYAVAGSAYSENGWAVEQGIHDTLALTQFFSETVGAPGRTILIGASMGSVIAFKMIEDHADLYDAAMPICGLGAGAPRAWDSGLGMTLAYDVAFGWPEAWGSVDDVRDDLWFEGEVAPILLTQAGDAANLGKFEFIRLVGYLPAEEFYDGNGQWLSTNMFFATEARAELERRAGGPIVQNRNHIYTLSESELAYLSTMGVDGAALLAQMNERTTYEADESARAYITSYAEYTGNITKPVFTLHTTVDGLTSATHETLYKELIEAAGNSDMLVQMYTESVGHCTFTPEQLLTSIGAVDAWVAGGVQPASALFSADLGFAPDFDPGPWPITFQQAPTALPEADEPMMSMQLFFPQIRQ